MKNTRRFIKLVDERCPVCDRHVPYVFQQCHHLIPLSVGGRFSDLLIICSDCHAELHRLFDNNFLKNYMHTLERIRDCTGLVEFVEGLKDWEFAPINPNCVSRIAKREKPKKKERKPVYRIRTCSRHKYRIGSKVYKITKSDYDRMFLCLGV